MLSILFCKKQESSSDTGTANNGFAQNKSNGLDTSKRVYVTASSLKVRTEPDLKAGYAGLLEKGDSFRVIEESESSITVDDGISGKWGGSWWCSEKACNGFGLNYRGKVFTYSSYNNNGFRCVKEIKTP